MILIYYFVVNRNFGHRVQSRAAHRYGVNRHTPGLYDRLHMRVNIAVSWNTAGSVLRAKRINALLNYCLTGTPTTVRPSKTTYPSRKGLRFTRG
jgi:hypothetical protein